MAREPKLPGMILPNNGLPPSTEAIADWLRESQVDRIAEIRAWYGDAAVLAILEKLTREPIEERASGFFRLAKADKLARRAAGLWPAAKYAEWVARRDEPVLGTVLATDGGTPRSPEDEAAYAEVKAIFDDAVLELGDRARAGRGSLPASRRAVVPQLPDAARCDAAERIIDYGFRNRPLLLRALTHSSFATIHNEQLAWLGDRRHNVWAAQRLYRTAPDAPIGTLTDAYKALCCETTQAAVFFALNLHELLAVGGSVVGNGGWVEASMAATGLEAIVAAIELDDGTGAAEAFLDRALAHVFPGAFGGRAP
ncbi:MAG: ribonuclease III domain-containing protein [Myxococcota bacterium]